MSNVWDAVRPFIAQYAPIIGASLGGPFGAGAGALVQGILGTKDATPASIQGAIQSGSLTGDQILKLKDLEQQFALQMKMADINSAEDAVKATADMDKAFMLDVQDARKTNGANRGTFWMGVCILLTFAVLMSLVLYACFKLVFSQTGIHLDPGTAAVVFTLIGTIIGYVASNAQTVINFEFGTSRGSSDRADKMASAVTDMTKAKL